MTRGRKKDQTIPVSRSLVLQRAYRDRKAKYVTELEERCQKAEEESERLRQELASTHATTPPNLNAVVVSSHVPFTRVIALLSCVQRQAQTCGEMLQQLDTMKGLVHRLQSQALAGGTAAVQDEQASTGYVYTPPSFFHGWYIRTNPPLRASALPQATSAFELSVATMLAQLSAQPGPASVSVTADPSADSADPESIDVDSPECCGGILDCRDLCADDHDAANSIVVGRDLPTLQQTSPVFLKSQR